MKHSFIAEIDQAEVLVRIFEGLLHKDRLSGKTAAQCAEAIIEHELTKVDINDRVDWERATRFVVEYFVECMQRMQRVS